jgi:hypothetical protein
MTKQDIYDIIYLLESHFESNGLDIREELLFRFVDDDHDFLSYDDKSLFTVEDENEDGDYDEREVDSVKEDLEICYHSPYYSDYSDNVENKLNGDIKKADFNLKVFKYLSQEFKVINFYNEDNEYFFTIKDTESNIENIDEKNKFKKMKYVKTFENFDNSNEIKKYLEDNYSEKWFNEQLDERAPDYADSDWEEDGYESESDWYQNHACGGAIEYDLIDEINKDVQRTFGLTHDQANPYVSEIFNKNCHWRDTFVFRDRSEKENLFDDYNDLKSKFDNLTDTFKSKDGRDIKI